MDPISRIIEAIRRIKEINRGGLAVTPNHDHAAEIAGELFELYGSIVEFAKLSGLTISAVDPSQHQSVEGACDSVLRQLAQLELTFAMRRGSTSARSNYETNLVELSKEQVREIETHISEAREKIRDSDAFEEKHKRRLLRRLEKLQAEIHKKISDLDVMLAGVTEVTAVAGQSAKNLNPVVDLFNKIFQIADSGNEEQLKLPAPPKQIEDKREIAEE
ncbi:hypothetical protein KUW17_00495 [Leisingera aquaemixtae]|uniref:hypothetical protein n=1 Tax=Leisingera aquaemixtae TaxID=1396826 RepID=UPI001C9633CC|nr:hypothetical protein [Leisingera aquaemixtae]MBY6065206.1 hypothetical protein [Leisingera aquaemixtae]